MSASVATRVSPIRTHHSAGEILQGLEMDKLRLMATYASGYSVACDCCANDSDTDDEENCGGLTVHNRRGNPCARFQGQQYRGLQNGNGTISIYSTLVRC